MDITYTMIGADGLHYGPVTLEQMQGWIAEGRIMPDTKILRSDTQSWLPASSYVELGLAPAVAIPVAPPLSVANPTRPAVVAIDPILYRRAQSGARWFFWIAGLSLVNTIMMATGAGHAFLIGMLGATEILIGAGNEMGLNHNLVTGLCVGVSAMYALFGFFAFRGQSWSYLVGGLIYALDSILFVIAGSWLVVIFHALVLFWIFRGLKANMDLKAQRRLGNLP